MSLRYVDHVGALGTPDMILLPGTKSTIADLRWLRERGLEAAILKEAAGGTLVFGVCGAAAVALVVFLIVRKKK